MFESVAGVILHERTKIEGILLREGRQGLVELWPPELPQWGFGVAGART